MVRFVDDFFRIALVGGESGLNENEWIQFKTDIDNFGILTWEFEEPSTTINFLDLTITIKSNLITTKT